MDESKGKNTTGIIKENNDIYINMIDSVKSKYILKKIFSILNEKHKLNIIIYNKNY